jgi:uncharacterized phage infection (PIP) family protein YhgE
MSSLFFDGVLILLVLVLLIYAVKLNQRLKNFQKASAEMGAMIGQLNQVIAASQQAVATLKEAAQNEKGRLEAQVKIARGMVDELQAVTETGENLAARIERGLVPTASEKNNSETEIEEELSDKEIREALKRVR